MIFDFSGGKLEFFKALYQEAADAMAAELELMQRRRDQYNGDKKIDGSAVPASAVRNITYELIESQVTSYIPTPSVSPMKYSEYNERNAKSIEVMLRAKRNDKPFEMLNDLDERFSPIYGGSVWLVEWDESEKSHDTLGDVKYTCLPPERFIGQPNVYSSISDMEYLFVTFETTKAELLRKYGVTPEVAEEAESDDASHDDGYTATLYVCYYRDENDCICQYIWSGETEIADISDYYARRRRVCRACGKREGLCECEKPDWEEQSAEEEVISSPITRSDGSVIPTETPVVRDGAVVTEKRQVQATTETGDMIFDDEGGIATPVMMEVEVPVTRQTTIPYYKPKVFPVVIRKNISKEDAVFGQSDCDAIRPQQQEINKIESRIQEKLLRSAVTPVMPEDARVAPDNSVFGQVIRLSPGENKAQYGVIDNTPNIAQDMAQSDRLYDHAKRILGISDSYQGQYDSSAHSGRAKQMQIQQAAGRLDSKRRMKNAAYAELDKITFILHLAYADEPRPSVFVDALGKRQNVEFNRYDFVAIDEAGEWYYDDRYLFACDASVDAEDQRQLLWEENLKSLQMGAFGNLADPHTLLWYWQAQERAHYPHARENVEYFKSVYQAAVQAAVGGNNVNNAR